MRAVIGKSEVTRQPCLHDWIIFWITLIVSSCENQKVLILLKNTSRSSGVTMRKKSQLVIIDTSELSPDILETFTSVTSRIIFDERKKLIGDDRRKKPVHLILDEAHRYIKKHYDYILKENIFEKIAREGRKYSFYLLVSSQRPSELSETVLSQCANFIIHRVQNEKDMHYIQAILPYFSDDFKNKIKQSIPGEALVFGNCVSMPLHLKIFKSNPSPNSDNCNIPEEWFKENGSNSMTNITGIVKSARKTMRQDTGTGSDELRILQQCHTSLPIK